MRFRNKRRWRLSNRAASSETSSTREMSQPGSPIRNAITTLREIADLRIGSYRSDGHDIRSRSPPRRENVESEYLKSTPSREDKKSNAVSTHSAQTSGNRRLRTWLPVCMKNIRYYIAHHIHTRTRTKCCSSTCIF